jgi:hypothetical protein
LRVNWKVKNEQKGSCMTDIHDHLPNVIDDPVMQLLIRGEARTVHETEEEYLNAAIPEILELLGSPLSNEELARHPLLNLMLAHGSRGWEDSTYPFAGIATPKPGPSGTHNRSAWYVSGSAVSAPS